MANVRRVKIGNQTRSFEPGQKIPQKTSELFNDSGFITDPGVISINGKKGRVNIEIPTKTSDLTNDAGFIKNAGVTSINGLTGDVTLDIGTGDGSGSGGTVTSVNGQTGDVSITTDSIGALPSTTAIPSKTSQLTNDSGFITSADIPAPPVRSVNGKTGDVIINGGLNAVESVNGQTGEVELTAEDVGAMPADYIPPVTSINGLTGDVVLDFGDGISGGAVSSVNGKTGDVRLTAEDVGAMSDDYTAPVLAVNGKTGMVYLSPSDIGAMSTAAFIPTKTSELTNDSGFVSNIPVNSVNGKTGNVVLRASDVGALSTDVFVPTKTSDIENDNEFITAADIPEPIIRSVNGKTGIVALSASDVAALPATTPIPSKISDLTNDSGFITSADIPPSAVTSVNGQTGDVILDITGGSGGSGAVDSVNGKTGTVVIDIPSKTSDLTNDSGFITTAEAPVTSINGQTGNVTLNIPAKTSELTNDAGFITSAPVKSVNGKVGYVALTAADVGALSSATVIPGKTSDLTNDSGFITSSDIPSSAVASVNGKTGTIELTASDVGALSSATAIPSKTSDLTNDSGFITSSDIPSSPVTSVNGLTGDVVLDISGGGGAVSSVNGQTGEVVLSIPDKTSELTNDSGFITSSTTVARSTADGSGDEIRSNYGSTLGYDESTSMLTLKSRSGSSLSSISMARFIPETLSMIKSSGSISMGTNATSYIDFPSSFAKDEANGVGHATTTAGKTYLYMLVLYGFKKGVIKLIRLSFVTARYSPDSDNDPCDCGNYCDLYIDSVYGDRFVYDKGGVGSPNTGDMSDGDETEGPSIVVKRDSTSISNLNSIRYAIVEIPGFI